MFSPGFKQNSILLSRCDLCGIHINLVYCGNSSVLYISYDDNYTLDYFQLA